MATKSLKQLRKERDKLSKKFEDVKLKNESKKIRSYGKNETRERN